MEIPQISGADYGPPYFVNQELWPFDCLAKDDNEREDMLRNSCHKHRITYVENNGGARGAQPRFTGRFWSIEDVRDFSISVSGGLTASHGGVESPAVFLKKNLRGGSFVEFFRGRYHGPITPEELRNLQLKRVGSILGDSITRILA